MALGDQSKSLIIISRMKGWDPQQIMDGENIANFDKAPKPWLLGDQSVGQLPEGLHDSYPTGHPSGLGVTQPVDFEHPGDTSGNTPNRRSSGADPTPAMPGAPS